MDLKKLIALRDELQEEAQQLDEAAAALNDIINRTKAKPAKAKRKAPSAKALNREALIAIIRKKPGIKYDQLAERVSGKERKQLYMAVYSAVAAKVVRKAADGSLTYTGA